MSAATGPVTNTDTPSALRYQVMTIDMLSADQTPVCLDGGAEWVPTRDRVSANDLRNGYVLTLVAGASPALGAVVRPVPGPAHSEPLTAYRVTITAANGTVTTDDVVYLR